MFMNRERGTGMLLHILIVLAELVGISNSFNFYEPARIPGWNYFGYTWPQPKPSVVFRKPMAAMVDLTNDLGVAILQDYSYSRSNFAFSPYGVASVLVVLYEGARGESARQIHRAVKFPWDRDITRVGFRDIHRHLRSYFSHEGYLSGITLSKEGSSLKPEYKRILRFYGYDVDVDSPERTTDSVPSATTEKLPSSSNAPSATTTPSSNGNDITTAKGIDSEETNIATTTISSRGNATLTGDETTTTSTTTTILEIGSENTQAPETTTSSRGEGGAETTAEEEETTRAPETTTSSRGEGGTETTAEQEETTRDPETTSPRGSSSEAATAGEEHSAEPPETTSPGESTSTTATVEPAETTQVFETGSGESSSMTTTVEQAPTTRVPVTTTTRESWSTATNAGQEETLPIATDSPTTVTEPSAPTTRVPATTTTRESWSTATNAGQEETLPIVTDSSTTVTEPSSESSFTTRQVATEAVGTTDFFGTDAATTSSSTESETTTDEGEESTSTAVAEELAALKNTALPEGFTEEGIDRKLNHEAFDNGMLIPQESNHDPRAALLFAVPDKRNVIGKESSLTEWEEVGGTLFAEGDRVKWEPKTLDQFLSDLISFANGTRTVNRNKRSAPEKPSRGRGEPSRASGLPGHGKNRSARRGFQKPSPRKATIVDFETCAQMKRSHSSKAKRTISEFLKIPGGVTDLSLQLQNGMFDSHVSKDSDLYRALPKFLFLVDGAIDTPVPMMSYSNFFPYSYIPRLHCKALEFPLDDERYKLLILLPVERRGLRQLIYDLSSYPLRDITDVLRPARVKAMVPTFMVEGFVILTPTLQKLGIWDVFDPRRSNLSGMSRDPELYVRNIEQSVTVVIRNYVEILDIQTQQKKEDEDEGKKNRCYPGHDSAINFFSSHSIFKAPRTSKTAPKKKAKFRPKEQQAARLPSFSLLKPDTPLLKSVITEASETIIPELEGCLIKEGEEEESEDDEEEEGTKDKGGEERGDEAAKEGKEEEEEEIKLKALPEQESPSSTMKFSGEAEILGVPVDTLFLNNNWGSGGSCDFLIDGTTKLMLDNSDDDMAKVSMDTLDSLLLNNSSDGNGNLAELKPLPPFTGYTGHLSINGIPGHHYHAIANQSPSSPSPSLEANNNISTVANQNTGNNSVMYKNNGATLYYEVSTTASDQGVVSSTVDCGVSDVKTEVDYNALLAEDIAAIIGSAIADTTVPNVVEGLDDPSESRDSWMDLDALIDGACISENGQKASDNVPEFAQPINCESASVTLQNLLQHGSQYGIHTEVVKQEPVTTNYQSNMSLLQSRLQSGPPCKIIQDCNTPSSTSYINGKDMMLPHTTSGSPPGHVSTTENLLLNGRYIQNRRNYPPYRNVKVPSPDMLINGNSLDNMVTGSGINSNYPHTTTSNLPNKKSRNRSNKKNNQMVFDGVGILGKEKPIHRCSICSRGFLNKSNIKVHLRTHTGEKPFRCDVCGKAFRQKAHLIKHQQMHKRVGRD